jgi:predicted phosphodiesterase
MRYLIVSDIHANWQALEAVLADADGQYEQILCCGDLVGYGADPNRVVDWAQTHVTEVVRGNHDRASAFDDDLEWFNPAARKSTEWTRKALTAANREWLQALPAGPRTVTDFDLIHGSPRDEDEYLVTPHDLKEAFLHMFHRLAFFGHTHWQRAFSWDGGRHNDWASGTSLDVRGNAAWLVNPGAVGQPRDWDPRAGYALFDVPSGEVQLKRVAYDTAAARRAILAAGLPRSLGNRLIEGM